MGKDESIWRGRIGTVEICGAEIVPSEIDINLGIIKSNKILMNRDDADHTITITGEFRLNCSLLQWGVLDVFRYCKAWGCWRYMLTDTLEELCNILQIKR